MVLVCVLDTYISSLYVQISVEASVSGRRPGVTGVTFSVPFQPVIRTEVKRAQKVNLPLLLHSKCHYEDKNTYYMLSVTYDTYEDFVNFPWEKINFPASWKRKRPDTD